MTAIADDLEALYMQAEIEKTKLAEKLVKKHPRKRKHGVLDTAVGLPPAIAEDSDSREQSTNLPRTRRSRRIAESATEPEASAMALVEPRPGPRSRDSACAHNETDSAVAVIGGSEAFKASRGSKRRRVSSTSRPETMSTNDALYVDGRGNAPGAVSFDESGQTANGSGDTNGEQSGTPFLHPSMPQNDGSTPIGFSGSPPFGGIFAWRLVHQPATRRPRLCIPPSGITGCAHCHSSTSTSWYKSKLEIGQDVCEPCYRYEIRHQRRRPLELEGKRKKR
ncbi:hypothetical protein B0H13DRAFT_2003539 [Mycena leptocephala]|nr:hypothetical protein B0H13DRAFT_2003539 [Mycena leptocephala]